MLAGRLQAEASRVSAGHAYGRLLRRESNRVSHRVGLGRVNETAFSWAAGALLLIGRETRMPAHFLIRGPP
jgi:hypothetical protein